MYCISVFMFRGEELRGFLSNSTMQFFQYLLSYYQDIGVMSGFLNFLINTIFLLIAKRK